MPDTSNPEDTLRATLSVAILAINYCQTQVPEFYQYVKDDQPAIANVPDFTLEVMERDLQRAADNLLMLGD